MPYNFFLKFIKKSFVIKKMFISLYGINITTKNKNYENTKN